MALRRSPQHLIEIFDASLPQSALVERRRMFGFPAAFVNGNLFCGLHQEDVVVRLSPRQRLALAKQGGRRWEPTPGRVMREYMLLPQDIEQTALKRWLARSFDFGRSLPVKVVKTQRGNRSVQ